MPTLWSRVEVESVVKPYVSETLQWPEVRTFEIVRKNSTVIFFDYNRPCKKCETPCPQVFVTKYYRHGKKVFKVRTPCPNKFCGVISAREVMTKDEGRVTDTDWAKWMALYIKDIVRYCPQKSSWYIYNGKRWSMDREGNQVRMTIDSRVIPCLNENFPDLDTNVLKSIRMRDSLLRECKGLLTDEKFFYQIDSNPLLVGFDNGVYDFSTHMFRDYLPDDFVTFSTGTTFIRNLKDILHEPSIVKVKNEIADFFRDICLDDIEKFHMLTNIIASAYNGSKRKQLFFMWEGGMSF